MEQRGFFQNFPPVTRNILIVNVIMFVAMWLADVRSGGTGQDGENIMVTLFALYPPSSAGFRWWQPVTYMFMHANFMHILCNMYTFVMFGCIVERAIGSKRFLWFYLITGLGAVALHLAVMHFFFPLQANVPMVGASGAIYGILVAFAMLYPQARITMIFPPITLMAKWWVTIFIVLEVFMGVTETGMGIAHFAHLGGALFGFLLILYWRKRGLLWRR